MTDLKTQENVMHKEEGERFADRYLRAVDALQRLDELLTVIGMGNCRELDDLRRAVIGHGADTHRDIERREIEEAPL